MELYRILLKSKDGASWFFIMDVFETLEEARTFIASHDLSSREPRIVMLPVVLFPEV